MSYKKEQVQKSRVRKFVIPREKLVIDAMPAKLPYVDYFLRRKKIVLLDDDIVFGKVLCYQLKHAGLSLRFFSIADEMFQFLDTNPSVDLFILDYNLGSKAPSGLDICRKIKAVFGKPVIMLTGDRRIETLVSCLSAGADQYIVKPCDIRELVARIDVSLRHYQPQNTDTKSALSFPLDSSIRVSVTEQRLIRDDGEVLELSRIEMGVLELLIAAEGGLIHRERAFKALFGFPMDPANRCIDLNISRIRSKLRRLRSTCDIKSVRGKGYRLTKANFTDDNYLAPRAD